MANIIPPMVSSSPPPLEDGEFGEEDEDDDHFGDVADLDSSYDLTGLSQVLKSGSKHQWGSARDGLTHSESNGSVILRDSAVDSGKARVPEVDLERHEGDGEENPEPPGWTWSGGGGQEKEVVWVPLRESRIAGSETQTTKEDEAVVENVAAEEESEHFGDFSSFQDDGKATGSCDDGCAETLDDADHVCEDNAVEEYNLQDPVEREEVPNAITISDSEPCDTLVHSEPESAMVSSLEGPVLEEDEDDFGNFSCAPEACQSDDFADFSSAEVFSQVEDVVPLPQSIPVTEVVSDLDDFDDFESTPTVAQSKVALLVATLFPSIPIPEDVKSCTLEPPGSPKDKTWTNLQDLDTTFAMGFHWLQSHSQQEFLHALGVDPRNVLFGSRWNPSVPRFAANLRFGPLEPVKAESSSTPSGNILQPVIMSGKKEEADACRSPSKLETTPEQFVRLSTLQDGSVPPAQFDWNSSGLVNPLDGGGWSLLDAGLFTSATSTDTLTSITLPIGASSLERDLPVPSSATKASPGVTLSPQLLPPTSSVPPAPATSGSWASLSNEARKIVHRLPDLSFIRSPVLAFPVRSSPDVPGQ